MRGIVSKMLSKSGVLTLVLLTGTVITAGEVSAQVEDRDVETESTWSPKDRWKRFNKKYDLMFVNEMATNTYVSGNDRLFYNDTLGYFTYHSSDKNSWRVAVEYWQENSRLEDPERETERRYETSELRYKRSKILTQKDHGINVSAELRALHYSNEIEAAIDVRQAYNARINASRSFGAFSLAATARYDVFDRTSLKPTVRKDQHRAYLSTSYSINDEWSVSNLIFYNRTFNDKPSGENTLSEFARVYPTVSKSLGKGLSADVYYMMTPYVRKAGKDKMEYVDGFTKKGRIAFSLTYVVF
ncbi:MAG: hypothetical protein ACPGJV_01865 [Bacteriovoracaceae bacterium]